MDIENKNIIIFGLGVTGISSIKALSKMGANIFIYDDKPYEEYKNTLSKIRDYKFNIIESKDEINWNSIYCVLKSPGIRLDNNFIQIAKKNNVEVLSDVEIAYRIWGGDKFIAVTGTNGKTTTTSLINHILNYSNIKSKVVGNIGVGILYEMYQNKDSIFVLELSSFQLSSVKDFRAKISIITNISKDHIDWHGSYEEYKKAKFNIFNNTLSTDTVILNKEDENISDINISTRLKYFSIKSVADSYLNNDEIVCGDLSFNRNILKLVGNHNVENLLAALLAIKEFDIDNNTIINAVESFSAIEHRIEFVKEINGVKYYNDSKGTNVDSTKVAIDGFNQNIILIAGGYDKNSEYDLIFKDNKNIKSLILFGETKEKIKECANKYKIKEINLVEDLENAVILSNKISKENDVVLFSPACASWDMYKNFEERGNHFKKLVRTIK